MPPTSESSAPPLTDTNKPPLFATWWGWYTLVISALVVELVGFTLLTYWFA